MDTILNTTDQAAVDEVQQLLQKLTPEEQRAALTYIQGVRLGQTTACEEKVG